jgi:EcoEI R protein C-terminal
LAARLRRGVREPHRSDGQVDPGACAQLVRPSRRPCGGRVLGSLALVADLQGVHDADGHDVIKHVAFSGPLVRRAERADAFLNHNADWLTHLPGDKREIVIELAGAYRDGGIDQLNRQILRLDRFKQYGGAVGVIKTLGGSAALDNLVIDLQDRLYPPLKEAA